jgi:hypothetical protein
MAKRKLVNFDVTCPSCRATLTIDPEVRAVLHHAPPPRSGPASSLDQAMEALRTQQARREAAFREAAAAEKTKDQVLSRKFEDGLKRAKDDPSRPTRPIDFD